MQSGRVLLTKKELTSSGQIAEAGPLHVAMSYVGNVDDVELYSFRFSNGSGGVAKYPRAGNMPINPNTIHCWCDRDNFGAFFQALAALSSAAPVHPAPVKIATLDQQGKPYGSITFDGAMIENFGPGIGIFCSLTFTQTAPATSAPLSFNLTQKDYGTLIYLSDGLLTSTPLPAY